MGDLKACIQLLALLQSYLPLLRPSHPPPPRSLERRFKNCHFISWGVPSYPFCMWSFDLEVYGEGEIRRKLHTWIHTCTDGKGMKGGDTPRVGKKRTHTLSSSSGPRLSRLGRGALPLATAPRGPEERCLAEAWTPGPVGWGWRGSESLGLVIWGLSSKLF